MTDDLLEAPLYGVRQAEKEARLTAALTRLTALHRAGCAGYRRIIDILGDGDRTPLRLSDVPWLPVGVFKSHRLASVPDPELTTTLTSSGTTGQTPSRIYLDKATSERQVRALSRIMMHVIPKRLPMIVVDTNDLLKNRTAFSARGAGVLGMMNFGAQPFFALAPDMTLDRIGLDAFLARHGGRPFLIFGFTYMVWAYLYEQVKDAGLDLREGILIHSGGWKKLADLAVDNSTFKSRLAAATGVARIYNFYGMVEQVGSVFLEGEDGLLYPPAFADVIVRDPMTFDEAPMGTPGIIQTVSTLPTSYPGHSLLTEDLGVIEHIDNARCGRLGKGFRVIGRLPRAELRGCSDTHAAETVS